MNYYMENSINFFVFLPRNLKRIIVILTDIILCILCTWFAFILRLEEFILFGDFNFNSILISIFIALPTFWLFGLYQTIIRFSGLSIITSVLFSILIYGLLYFSAIGIYSIHETPKSIGIIQPMLLFFAIISTRLGAKYILSNNYNYKKLSNKKNVIIYGAGQAGRQLMIALHNSPEFNTVGFLDDDVRLHKQIILGQIVYSPYKLKKIVNSKNIHLALLAIPSINKIQKNQIIERLNKYKLSIKTLPSVSEIVGEKVEISDIKDLNINDLLNREEIKPDAILLKKNIAAKAVLVTGAGGSIGSELCRQIVRLKPNKLLLLELNEFALYKTYEEIIKLNENLEIIPLLINVQDQDKLERIFEIFKIDTVYHTAAYKHVSLVEGNVCEGVKNNVFSALAIAKAAVAKKISNVVLISSDKAVRPTNIMGASKRLSELCVQGVCNQSKNISTNFSIVRFGNVIESSGSVIPKFKQQIKEGGPITLTHEDVTRYFMTVTEAAQLVIQAGAMGKSSEVYVLDMGESIKIKDLIEKIINLSGLTIRDNKNPKGDIEIKITGLKPGEKLYEELLIGENPEATSHPKINKASDSYIPFNQLEVSLKNLKILLDENKVDEVKNLLSKLLKLYKSNTKIVDYTHVEKLSGYDHKKIYENKDSIT